MSGSSANGYKEFLKHLGIDPTLMADDMRIREDDSEWREPFVEVEE